MVGPTGFEPATTCTPCRCATRLRYGPPWTRWVSGVLARLSIMERSALSILCWPVQGERSGKSRATLDVQEAAWRG